MNHDLDLIRQEFACTFIRWTAELDAPTVAALAGKPITATLSAAVYAGELEVAALNFDRQVLSTRTETRRLSAGNRPPVMRDLADLLTPNDLAVLDQILATPWRLS